MFKLNKKGNIDDLGFALGLFFIFALTSVLVVLFIGEIKDNFDTNSAVPDSAKNFMTEYDSKVIVALDYAFVLVLLGTLVFSIVTASRIQTSTVFYLLSIIWVIFVWMFAIIVSYLWKQMTVNSAQFATVAQDMPMINFIMPKLLYVILIYSMILSIVLYTKD